MKSRFNIKIEFIADYPVLYLSGEITSESEEYLDRVYKETTESGNPCVILNFKDVKYINSAGMAILLGLVTQMLEKEHDIKFVSLSPHFKKIVEMIGMTEFVTIYDTNEDAIASFG